MDKHPTYRGRAKARAKLNLSLEVLGCRPDGLHELRSVMTTLCLADQLSIYMERTKDHLTSKNVIVCDDTQQSLPWQITTNVETVPTNDRNIVYRAARLFFDYVGIDPSSVKLAIFIDKQIPDAAGLGGGSADAAAILRFLFQSMRIGLPALCDRDIPSLTHLELEQIALKCGADVPFCLYGGTRLCEGVGEIMTPLPPLRQMPVLLATPSQSVQTKRAFQMLDEQRSLICRASERPLNESNESHVSPRHLYGDSLRLSNESDNEWGHMNNKGMRISSLDAWIKVIESGSFRAMAPFVQNDFISVIREEHQQVASLLEALRSTSARIVSMSGSGPTCFAIFESMPECEEVYRTVVSDFPQVRFIKTQTDPVSDL